MLNDLESIRKKGFEGFLTVGNLRTTALHEIPDRMGVYLVLRVSQQTPEFLAKSPAGHFKGKDPTVPLEVLHVNWVNGAKRSLPPLTILVVRGDTGMPGTGFVAAQDIPRTQLAVFSYDWLEHEAPSPEQLEEAVSQRPSNANPAAVRE